MAYSAQPSTGSKAYAISPERFAQISQGHPLTQEEPGATRARVWWGEASTDGLALGRCDALSSAL